MQRHGFIHDMMDVKVLILFVMSRSSYPMTTQEVYEVCYQDECLSYFDVCTAIPEMVQSGHVKAVEDERFEITEKGRQDGAITEDSVAFTVRQRAESAVARFNRQLRRGSLVKTRLIPRENEECSVVMLLDDQKSNLMTLELTAPNQRQAVHLSKRFEAKAEIIYNLIMKELLAKEED